MAVSVNEEIKLPIQLTRSEKIYNAIRDNLPSFILVAPRRGPSHRDVLESLERFAKKVMPALQENGGSA